MCVFSTSSKHSHRPVTIVTSCRPIDYSGRKYGYYSKVSKIAKMKTTFFVIELLF